MTQQQDYRKWQLSRLYGAAFIIACVMVFGLYGCTQEVRPHPTIVCK